MYLKRIRYFLYLVIIWLLFGYKAAVALEFKPGVGVGMEYTDNARLTPDNIEDELITIGYVGASIAEREGPLKLTGAASVTQQNYSKDTFEDQRYLNLLTSADWEMIKDRFHWTLSDVFTQKSVVANTTVTPDNLQNSNVFKFGANILFPISARQNFSISPTFSQYYYETTKTNSKQYAVAANWNYQIFRLTNVGLNFGVRKVDYIDDKDLVVPLPNTTFTNLAVVIAGERVSSNYTANLGATNVRRNDGEDFTGFTGRLTWSTDVSSRSEFNALLSSVITDAGSVSSTSDGSGDDIQTVADVIRDSVFKMSYSREDVDLHSRLWVEYRESKYDSNTRFDQIIRITGVRLDFPGTQLFSSGLSARYKQFERLNDDRLDESFIVDTGFDYKFSRKLSGAFNLQYSTKESTEFLQNHNELSFFINLAYGYGSVNRSSRGGNF